MIQQNPSSSEELPKARNAAFPIIQDLEIQLNSKRTQAPQRIPSPINDKEKERQDLGSTDQWPGKTYQVPTSRTEKSKNVLLCFIQYWLKEANTVQSEKIRKHPWNKNDSSSV